MVALVSHASKIILKIVQDRIKKKTETEIAEEQAGFQPGKGTRDQITNLRIIMHKAKEHQQPLYSVHVLHTFSQSIRFRHVARLRQLGGD